MQSLDHVLVIQLSRLSPSLYPEYSRIFKLMIGHCEDYYYTKVTCATIESLNNGTVCINSLQGIFTASFFGLCKMLVDTLDGMKYASTAYQNMKRDFLCRR